ncbi:GMC family oxidoreductase N-terminal domain-containing protein [Methylobacterium phyllosphaerae]
MAVLSRPRPASSARSFDGFPCPTNGKSDAQTMVVDPALRDCPNLTLLTRTYIERLVTDPSGRSVTGVVGNRDGAPFEASADIVVVACGALSSALLLLRSANAQHPNGLANGSDQVGRNYMRHNNSTVLAISKVPNPTRFQKTLGLNDFYFGDPDPKDGWDFPSATFRWSASRTAPRSTARACPASCNGFPTGPSTGSPSIPSISG